MAVPQDPMIKPAPPTSRRQSAEGARQRVLTALDHREPDRVPFDLGGTAITGIHVRACAALRSHLGLPSSDVPIADPAEQLGLVEDDLADALGVDVRGVGFADLPSVTETPEEFRYWDKWGIGWRMPKDGGLYFDMFKHPLAGDIEERDLEQFNWPGVPTRDELAPMRDAIQRIHEEQGRAVVVDSVCWGLMETVAGLRGYEGFYSDVALNPDRVGRMLDRILDWKLSYWERVLDLCGDTIDVVKEADDFAGQHSLLISPDAYRRLVKPRQRELFSYIHSRSSARIFFHSCGAMRELIPDLIEVGIDVLNPVQVSAARMDTRELKAQFGAELSFWGGGVDTQRILCGPSEADVRDEVRRRLDDLMPGGGFVFSAVHNVQSDVPPANIIAMWETLREYGVYEREWD